MTPRLTLSTQTTLKAEGIPAKAVLKRWLLAALQPGERAVEINLRFVDSDEGQMLNRDYRGRDYATNVLTFTYDDGPPLAGVPLMGDMVFCHPVVLGEAAAQGIALEAHYAHLVVHGALHLQGFDHEDDDEATAMEALETDILAALGFADPYATEKED